MGGWGVEGEFVRKAPPKMKPLKSKPMGGGGQPPKKGGGCCPMVAALRSAKLGQFRLARRYAVMSVRLIAARF